MTLALRIFQRKRVIMPTGVVKWFNPAKGFGFIVPDEGGNDVFVHASTLRAGLQSLNEGQKVEYELVPSRDGKFAAENLVVLDRPLLSGVVAARSCSLAGRNQNAPKSQNLTP